MTAFVLVLPYMAPEQAAVTRGRRDGAMTQRRAFPPDAATAAHRGWGALVNRRASPALDGSTPTVDEVEAEEALARKGVRG